MPQRRMTGEQLNLKDEKKSVVAYLQLLEGFNGGIN
jgi:hypothetical protein